jgi:hypothetical protein
LAPALKAQAARRTPMGSGAAPGLSSALASDARPAAGEDASPGAGPSGIGAASARGGGGGAAPASTSWRTDGGGWQPRVTAHAAAKKTSRGELTTGGCLIREGV